MPAAKGKTKTLAMILACTLAACSGGQSPGSDGGSGAPKNTTVSATLSHLSVSSTTAAADGSSAVTVTATVLDPEGKPIGGVSVIFSATGSGNTWMPATALTNSSGIASAQLRSTGAGSRIVSATANDVAIVQTVQVTFSASPPACPTPFVTVSDISGPGFAIGELNNDGAPDLAFAYYNRNTVEVLLASAGAFAPATVAYATGDWPLSVAIGDLDGDGKLDLVVANEGSNEVGVHLGSGNGAFDPEVAYSAGVSPISVAIGDLNGDGKPDVVVANDHTDYVSALLGNGDGTFQAKIESAAGGTISHGAIFGFSATGDLNGDGKIDLAIIRQPADNKVGILLGNGDGTFATAVDYATGETPYSLAIGDLNGDGKLDLVVASSWPGSVGVFLGNGDGTFKARVDYPTGQNTRDVAIGDLNGDGKPDLAVSTDALVGSGPINVLLGNGDGTFQAKLDFSTGQLNYGIKIGDLTGDGHPELVVASGGGMKVLQAQCLP